MARHERCFRQQQKVLKAGAIFLSESRETAFQEALRIPCVSRRTIDFIAALASSVVASMPIVFPFSSPACATCRNTQTNTSWCVASSISPRVGEIVTWSGPVQSNLQNCRKHSESATRQAVRYRSLKKADQHQTEIHTRRRLKVPILKAK